MANSRFLILPVKWMIHNYNCNASTLCRCFSVFALVFFFTLHPICASAQSSPDYSQDLADLQNALEIIINQLGNIYNPLGPPVAQQQYDGRMDFLFNLLGYGQTVSPDRNILVELEKLVSKPTDTLASNPWWSTNSAFALTKPKYSSVFPDDGRDTSGIFSFPQFLSKWSSFLTVPVGSSRPITSGNLGLQWSGYFGLGGRLGGGASTDEPYTWFDFMADSMRSNWTIHATNRDYVEFVDSTGAVVVASIRDSIRQQDDADAQALDTSDTTLRIAQEPDGPTYTPVDDNAPSPSEANKDNLLDAGLQDDVQHSTRLVLINATDFQSATGVSGEMVYNLEEGRFSSFVSDMSSISRAGWYGLLAVFSATLFWRKQNEISGIVKATNFSRV